MRSFAPSRDRRSPPAAPVPVRRPGPVVSGPDPRGIALSSPQRIAGNCQTPRPSPSASDERRPPPSDTAARLGFNFARIPVFPPGAAPTAMHRPPDRAGLCADTAADPMAPRIAPPWQRSLYSGQAPIPAGLPAGGTRPGFMSNRSFSIAGRIPPLGDPIHDPLLDRYSRDTGLPRDTVTQHDPGYEAWLLGRPAAPPPINVVIDMPVPGADPAPDYSRDENRLNAWEKADFNLSVQQSFSCDHVVAGGVESSFVTDVGFRFTQSDFQYFIARHIHENMTDRTLAIDVRTTWRRIHARIRTHAREHFTRYRQVADAMRQDIAQRFAALPTRNSPIQIPQADLETYVADLLQYLTARLHFELWQTTCDWETTDYPNLLSGIPNVGGRLTPACGSAPAVPSAPILPIVITPGAGSSPGRTRRVP